MKMRELERATGVNRETIRVYIREGLLPEPERPKGNVADYSAAHVSAIRAIRELKRGGNITVPQLKRALKGDPAAMPADPAAFPHLDTLLAARLGIEDGLVPMEKLAASHAEAAEDIRGLAKIGAVKPVRRGGRSYLTQPDAQIVMLWGQMRAAGFDEAHGFTPAVLRFYVEAAQALAGREVSEFLRILAGAGTGETEAAAMAQAATTLMLPFFGHLRTKAVLAAFREVRARAGRRKRR